jgi:serine/threonine protein kinase
MFHIGIHTNIKIYQKDLGKGQFGVVFKAKHSVSGIRVAIKEIDTDQVSTANLPGVMV